MTDFEKTKELAKEGDAEAQNNLGYMYLNGLGVEQNDAEALRWYTKAAEQGHAYAQFHLGVKYYNGEGVKQNDAEAVRWFTKSAEQGYSYAQKWLDRLTPPAQKKLDFANKSRLDLLSGLAKEINDVVRAYDGAITLAEALGVLEIAKIELYNNQSVSTTTTK
jgi:hypothetical protein